MFRYVPLALAFLASVCVGLLYSPDLAMFLVFSTTILGTIALALLIRLAWGNRLYRRLEKSERKL